MVAIIPARGGSKGVPGKNIRPLSGKPLIAYTIEAALGAECIDDVIVSTDSAEIAAIAKQYGARVPFLRPAELATDTSAARDVYLHAIDFLNAEKQTTINKFMVLLPTAPFRTAKDIDAAFGLYTANGAETLLAVKEAETPPSWYLSLNEADWLSPCGFGGADGHNNRQANAKYYIACGAIYILDYLILKEKKSYFSDKTAAYIIDGRHSVDIDTLDDFGYAEYLVKNDLL